MRWRYWRSISLSLAAFVTFPLFLFSTFVIYLVLNASSAFLRASLYGWESKTSQTLSTLPSLLPSFRGITSFPPKCPRPTAEALHFFKDLEFPEDPAYHIPTNTRTSSLKIRQGKFT